MSEVGFVSRFKSIKWTILIVVGLTGLLTIIGIASGGEQGKDDRMQEYLNRGFNYLKIEKYEKASRVFESATILDPDNPDACIGLALSYYYLGSNESMTVPELLEKAIASSKKVLKLGISDPKVHEILFHSYLALNDKKAAMEQYEIIKKMDVNLAAKLKDSLDNYRSPQKYNHTKTQEIYTSRPNYAPYREYGNTLPRIMSIDGSNRNIKIESRTERNTRGRIDSSSTTISR